MIFNIFSFFAASQSFSARRISLSIEAYLGVVIFNVADVGCVAADHFRQVVLRQAFAQAQRFYFHSKLRIIKFLLQFGHLLSIDNYNNFILLWSVS